jgi:hypothetical protein
LSVEITTCNGYIDAGVGIFNRGRIPSSRCALLRTGDARPQIAEQAIASAPAGDRYRLRRWNEC